MRLTFKSLTFLFIVFAMVGIFTSCSEDDALPNGGKPMVSYVRVTKPTASDSLLAKAGQGQMIAIIGQNLGEAVQIWFNNRQGQLSPTYVTNTSIITRVPTEIPTQISNKIKLYFSNGDSLLYDFKVDISEPIVTSMVSEYVLPGSIATIRGNYFYAPLTVTFTGGQTGEVVSVKDNLVEVRVPAGAQPGPITVTTNFGKTASKFWFKDNRNIIASFDGGTSGNWTGSNYIKDADADVTPINGKFIRFNKALGPYPYAEFYVGPSDSDIAKETKNIPADAFANPKNYSLKFEINTLAALSGAELRMYMGNNMPGERDAQYYNWKPNVDSKGQWQTVSIPFEDFWIANKKFAYNPNGYGASFWFHGSLAVNTNFALDNLRVVPNTL